MIIKIDKKIYIKDVCDDDFHFLKNIYQDEQIQKLALANDSFEVQDINITNTINFFKNSDDRLLIIYKKEKRIGFLTLYELSYEKKEIKLGIVLIREYQNSGIGLKVFFSIKKYIYEELKLTSIISEVIEYNTTVSNMLKRVGFKLTSVKQGKVKKGSNYYDLELYTLVSS